MPSAKKVEGVDGGEIQKKTKGHFRNDRCVYYFACGDAFTGIYTWQNL